MKALSAALFICLSGSAFAADYYLVVPVPNRTASVPITVALSTYTLPGGIVGVAYPAFDFKPLLSVTGDASFNAASVSWSVSSGSLPAGMSLSAQGVLSGTPTADGTASFTLSATYKTSQGSKTYQVAVSNLTVSLAEATLPVAQSGVFYSYDFKQHLSVVGDPAFDASQATWTLLSGSPPPGMTVSMAGILSGTPTGQASSSLELQATYKNRTGARTYTIQSVAYSSCKAMLAAEPGKPSGWYTLDVDGTGPVPAQSYYCDMVSSGGGWTRVVRQYETTPVLWGGAVSGASYSLAANSIPAHTQTGFGKDDLATDVGYANFVYTTNDIPVTVVTNIATGVTHQIHRSATMHYGSHNPDGGVTNTVSDWNNSLTFDAMPGAAYTWAFSPKGLDAAKRGYAYLGSRASTAESFAWTVWVR